MKPSPRQLALTPSTPETGTVVLRVEGDLDHDSAAHLLAAVAKQLAVHPEVLLLRLDCAGLGLCDSTGLSALLMAHRLTTRRGVRLRLDGRTAALDRLLTVTGTLAHFATARAAEGETEDTPRGRP